MSGDALAEMSRYHAVEFIISDPALRSRQISGTFSTGDLPRAVQSNRPDYVGVYADVHDEGQHIYEAMHQLFSRDPD